MVAHTYAHLHGLPSTGLRFFTVYGPAGRPDTAYFGFTKAIVGGTPIQLFNQGQLERDFTYIDDIVSGVVAATAVPPVDLEVRYRLLNLGNHQHVKLGDFIATLEGCWAKTPTNSWSACSLATCIALRRISMRRGRWLALSPALISAPDLSASSRGTATTIRCNPLR